MRGEASSKGDLFGAVENEERTGEDEDDEEEVDQACLGSYRHRTMWHRCSTGWRSGGTPSV